MNQAMESGSASSTRPPAGLTMCPASYLHIWFWPPWLGQVITLVPGVQTSPPSISATLSEALLFICTNNIHFTVQFWIIITIGDWAPQSCYLLLNFLSWHYQEVLLYGNTSKTESSRLMFQLWADGLLVSSFLRTMLLSSKLRTWILSIDPPPQTIL